MSVCRGLTNGEQYKYIVLPYSINKVISPVLAPVIRVPHGLKLLIMILYPARKKSEDICWENASKNIKDFALAAGNDRAVSAIRFSILSHASDAEGLLGGEIELDESYFGGKRKGKRGRGAAGKLPVFGILERNGVVQVDVVPDVTAETLLGLILKKVRRGSVVYTDKFKLDLILGLAN